MAQEDILKEILAELKAMRAAIEKIDAEEGAREMSPSEEDHLFEDAQRLVIKTGAVSIALLQKKLGVGYARAMRLIDLLEQQGVVTYAGGSSRRELALTPAALEVLKKIEAQLKKRKKDQEPT